MNLLVSYDIDTTTPDGRRRLRHIATICKSFGQRVQYSVFELSVDRAQLEALEHQILETIEPATDSVRIYRLPADRDDAVTVHGQDDYTDYDEPLVF